MASLATRSCEICRKGAPRATPEETAAFLQQLPGWTLVNVDGVERLTRRFAFADFAAALAFTNRVGAIAEAAGHHPLLVTEWGRVTVQWWTHKIGGLHRNDFIMAARTDTLQEEAG